MNLRIAELRKSLGLTQKEFVKKTNISKSLIQNYESNSNSNPSIEKIEKIANAFDVNPAWLVGWDENSGMSKTIIKEKTVYVENTSARVPSDWKSNQNGQLINWIER